MKRVSILLAVVLVVVSVLPPASAAEAMRYNALQSIYAQQYVMKTEVKDVVQDVNGNYAIVSTDNANNTQTFLPVGRYDVFLNSEDSVNSLRNIEGLGQELINDVVEMAQRAEVNGEDAAMISVYSPALLPENQSNSSYEYYDGNRFKIELLSFDRHTDFASLASGTNIVSTLSSITNVAISIAGIFKTSVGIFGAGMTLLSEIYEQEQINNVYPSSNNSVVAKIRYTRTVKYTYGEMGYLSGDWRLGCVSSHVSISEYIFSYDFYKGGIRDVAGELMIFSNKGKAFEISSENYDSGYMQKAWANLFNPWIDGEITVKIGSKTFYLI